MKSFARREISGADFVQRFLSLRREDLDKDLAVRSSWASPRDQDLANALQRGAISQKEFQRQWGELWGYDPNSPWLLLFETMFRDVDQFAPDGGPGDVANEDSIDETELRRRVIEHIATLEALTR